MTDHMPTPWFHEPAERGSLCVLRSKVAHPTGSGEVVARNVELRDALFIVRAVNSHDELVAALKTAAYELATIHNRKLTDGEQSALSAATAALAKAGAL